MKIKMVLALMVMMAIPIQGQVYRRHHSALEDGDDYHFGYISGSVGYSMLQTTIPNAMPEGQVGGSVGIGYEFRNSGLWTNMGIQMSFHRSALRVDDYTFSLPGEDTQGKPVTLLYTVSQRDEFQWNYIDIPLQIGYYVKGFHVGGGIKVSYALNPTTRSKGTYHLSGQYETYDPIVTEGHGYGDYPFDNTNRNQLNVGASLIGEIGYDLLSPMLTKSRICHVLKIAFTFEYGLNNQFRSWGGMPPQRIVPSSSTLPTPATSIVVNPYLNTFDPPQRAVPFLTGVKITYMIGGSRTARSGMHHGCMCYN